MVSILFPVGLCLLVLALALLILLLNDRRYQKRRLLEERHRALGLPPGELVYEDADGLGEPLSSNHYPLVGKPDYVVQLAKCTAQQPPPLAHQRAAKCRACAYQPICPVGRGK